MLFILPTAWVLSYCGSNPQSPKELEPTTVAAPTDLTLLDQSDWGDGRDLAIEATAPSDDSGIEEYRFFVVKAEVGNEFQVETGASAGPSLFKTLPTGSVDLSTQLAEGSVDSDGDPIGEGQAYIAVVVSVASNDSFVSAFALSTGNFVLDDNIFVPSAVAPDLIDIGNSQSSADLVVSFSVPDESDLSEYRVMLVPSDSSSVVDRAFAEGVSPDRYSSLRPFGAEQSHRFDGQVDVFGSPISAGVNYRAIVASVPSDRSMSWALSASAIAKIVDAPFVIPVAHLPASTGGIDVDHSGLIYVADIGLAPARQGNTIYRVTPGQGPAVFAQGQGMLGVSGNAFLTNGNLVQANLSNSTLSLITPDGTASTLNVTGVAGPVGVIADGSDTLYIANCGNNSILKVNPDLASTQVAAGGLLSCPNGIAIGGDGNVYVSNFNNGLVLRIERDGTISQFANLPGGNNGHLIHRDGIFYVVARSAHQIYSVTSAGEVSLLAGSGLRGNRNGTAEQATLSLPNDLVFNGNGDTLYFNEVDGASGTANQPSNLRAIVLD